MNPRQALRVLTGLWLLMLAVFLLTFWDSVHPTSETQWDYQEATPVYSAPVSVEVQQISFQDDPEPRKDSPVLFSTSESTGFQTIIVQLDKVPNTTKFEFWLHGDTIIVSRDYLERVLEYPTCPQVKRRAK